MMEKDTEKRISLMERELSVLVEDLDSSKLDLRSELAALRIEIESIKQFLGDRHPEFAGTFHKIKTRTARERNPEWISEPS